MVYVNFDAVVTIRNITDRHIVQLTATEATIELNRVQCFITRVSSCIDNRQNVGVPLQHIHRVRSWIVVVAVGSWSPGDAIRITLFISYPFPENTQGDSIVPISLFTNVLLRVVRIVFGINSPDDGFGRFTVVKGLVESSGVFSHTCAVAKEFEVAVSAIVLSQQVQSIAEFHEDITVGWIIDFSTIIVILIFNAVAERFELTSWVVHGSETETQLWGLLTFGLKPGLGSFRSTTFQNVFSQIEERAR